ncbi:hypothetical protein [Campylobacter jejuni]|uniref:hypothetical protein n=1 Tax=Campylobacter jejuni TaxID=197 RepID=UPI0011A7F880|nr:hypothetical protein [Campylobacter jejuni]HEH5497381.1 hypothetical protein [Campylobacter coli]
MDLLKKVYIAWIVFWIIGHAIFLPTAHGFDSMDFTDFFKLALQFIAIICLPPLFIFNIVYFVIKKERKYIIKALWILLYYPMAFIILVIIVRSSFR